MKELYTEIEIQASPEKVWQILTDLDKYPDWNPFIHKAIGKAKAGEKVDITFRSTSKEMTLHCHVITAEPVQELCWKYHVILPALFSGAHTFRIEPMGTNQVRLPTGRYSAAGWFPYRPETLTPIRGRGLKK